MSHSCRSCPCLASNFPPYCFGVFVGHFLELPHYCLHLLHPLMDLYNCCLCLPLDCLRVAFHFVELLSGFFYHLLMLRLQSCPCCLDPCFHFRSYFAKYFPVLTCLIFDLVQLVCNLIQCILHCLFIVCNAFLILFDAQICLGQHCCQFSYNALLSIYQ